MKRMLLSAACTMVLSTGSVVPAFAATTISGNGNTINVTDNSTTTNIQFNDLGGYNWAKQAIGALVRSGVLHGVDNKHFQPGQKVTRAQFAVMVDKFFNLKPPADPVQDFNDVPPTNASGYPNWEFPYVEAAKNYMTSSPDLNGGYDFNPNTPLSRQEATFTLVDILVKEGILQLDSPDQVQQVLGGYADGDQVAPALQPYVATAITADLMSGVGDHHLAPNDPMTRAQAAVLLDRIENDLQVIPGDTSSSASSTSGSTVSVTP